MLLERAFWYHNRTALAVQEKPQQRIVIRGKSDFYLRAYGVRGGDCEIRCRRGDDAESYFQSGWVHSSNILDDANLGAVPALYPIAPEIRYPLNRYFTYDIRSENTGDFDVVLQGVNKFDGEPRELGYPDHYEEETADLEVDFEIAADTSIQNLQIRHPNRGVAFAIRGLTWIEDPSFSATATRNLLVLIRDHNDQAFMNQPVPIDMLFSDSAPLMGTPFPELVIPAGLAFNFDVVHDLGGEAGGPWRVCLGFKGAFLHAR